MRRQSTMIALLVVLMMALCDSTTANPLMRVRRQGWSWDGTGEFRPVPSTQPPSPWRPTVTSPGTVDGEDPNSTTTTASPAYAQCMANCRTTKQYNPVCGTNRVTYENQALLNCAVNCGVVMFIITLMGTSRAAPATREKRQNWVRTNEDDEWFVFDSVGGSSSIIAPKHRQPKPPPEQTTGRPTSSSTTETQSPPSPTARSRCEQECLATNEYNPVCTMDNVTYANPGKLRCALMCGKRVTVKRFGRC